MRTEHHRAWPAFAGVAALAAIGFFLLDGVARGVVGLVAFLAFIFACIYALRGENVNDGVGGIGGPFSHM